MSNSKCNCEAKLLVLEKEIKELHEEFEMAQAYIMELIENLTVSIDGCYDIDDSELY